jgi:hypothetical protein
MPLDLVERVEGDGGHACLPSSIPAGNVEFAEESVRCRLQLPPMNARSVPPYISEQKITLQAVLPWLKQELGNFDITKSITLQFPLELKSIKVPSALAPRFGYSLRWEVSRLVFGARLDRGLTAADMDRSSTRVTGCSAMAMAPEE